MERKRYKLKPKGRLRIKPRQRRGKFSHTTYGIQRHKLWFHFIYFFLTIKKGGDIKEVIVI